MGKRHLFRLAAPRSWPIERKLKKWVVRPVPGPYALNGCLPLALVLRDVLRYAKTKKEVNFILNGKEVLVNKVVRTEKRFPLGFMDVFELARLNEHYRVLYDKKGRLCLRSISKSDSGLKICKVIGKKTLKGKRIQLNLFDGRNILVNKDVCSVGDSVVFDFENKSIKNFLKLEKGALVYLTGGRYIGHVCKVNNIINFKGLQKPRIILSSDGKVFETMKEYAFVIGKEKSVVSLGEK